MEISKLLPSSSSSSEPLLSSFVALHVAGHIYTRDTPCNTTFYRLPLVYAMLVCTMELAFYHSLSVHTTLIHTMGAAFCRARVTLVHTIAYRQCRLAQAHPNYREVLLHNQFTPIYFTVLLDIFCRCVVCSVQRKAQVAVGNGIVARRELLGAEETHYSDDQVVYVW